jgi:hypothetical protein
MTAFSRLVVCAAARCPRSDTSIIRGARVALGGVALSAAIAAQAFCEPVKITGGSMNVPALAASAPIDIAGTRGFSFNGSADPLEGAVDAFASCTPCTPGEMISVAATLLGAFNGTATLDGNTYNVEINNFNPRASMSWNISAPTLTAPAEAPSAQFLQAPFTLTGFFTPDATPPSGMPIQIALIGRGTATLGLRPSPGTNNQPFLWETANVRYAFSDATVTPEPASLILIGIGTAMCGLRRVIGSRSAS